MCEQIANSENPGLPRVSPGKHCGSGLLRICQAFCGLVLLSIPQAMSCAEATTLPLFLSASEPLRQGFVRIVNHSDHAGDVSLTAIDDTGHAFDPFTLTLRARQAVHFNSDDLEYGNPGKGIETGIGASQGDWRLAVDSTLNVEALAYIRTRDGLLTSVHDTVPKVHGRYRVAIFNPGSNSRQESRLRLINPGESETEVTIRGLDDSGASAGPVSLTLPAGEARSVSSRDLENGAASLTGALGDGNGKWRLEIEAGHNIQVLSLMESPAGHITNLSSLAGDAADGLPLFLAAGSVRRQGFVRLINQSAAAGEVEITAFDTRGRMHGPVTLNLEPRQAVHFNADDLETGNESKGIPKGIGNGRGDWRLRIESSLDTKALAFVRTYDGFVTSVHDVAPMADELHRIATFNPASNSRQSSRLRLVNPGDLDADITIGAWDDSGEPGGDVWLKLPAGHAVSLSAQELEAGTESLGGRFGDGLGKWRLFVRSTAAIEAMSLLHSSTYHVTNLSTSTAGPLSPPVSASCFNAVADADGDGIADHCDNEPQTARRSLSGCSDGTWVEDADENIGLVMDCRILISFANIQVQNSEAEIDRDIRTWGAEAQGTIWGWDGLNLGRHPGRVKGLWLFNRGLSGPIPPELAQFTELRWLHLSENNFSGPIPPELGMLANLEALHLSYNQLSGPIPKELAQLKQLEHLTLSTNRLTGPIPEELGELSNLQGLLLSGNQLTGKIPLSLAGLTSLRTLWAGGNFLSGPVPEEFGNLGNLQSLILFGNLLTGTIPRELAQMANLETLDLSENRLSGPLPIELSQLPNLRDLRLKGNRLTGIIPPEYSKLENLDLLWLDNNLLSGPIPPELEKLTHLWILRLNNNRLSGSIPPNLARLRHLEYVQLSDNDLIGTIPRELLQLPLLVRLDLFGNNLQGLAQVARTPFSTDPEENGNAAHHSVAYYQGPLGWEWNWRDEPVEHQRPIAGRRTALAVRIDHETKQAPQVATSVLDARGDVLIESLEEAGLSSTASVESGHWRTEYVFDLPGEMNQPGYQLIHTIDPDNEMPEIDEEDNVGGPITLESEVPPEFSITFIPIIRPGARVPRISASELMIEPAWLLPVADKYKARVADARASDARDQYEVLHELTAAWNAEAEPDEFYHGICRFCNAFYATSIGGRVAVGSNLTGTAAHALGHNLGLGHVACRTLADLDPDYPYAEARLGPEPGWSFLGWRHIGPDDGYFDFMGFCYPAFVSDYNFRKAADHWLGVDSRSGSSTGLYHKADSTPGTASWGRAQPAARLKTTRSSEDVKSSSNESLAISGRIDSKARWSLTHAQMSRKAPRSPALPGGFTLIVEDLTGAELHREPLAVNHLSKGAEAAWAARVPLPAAGAAMVTILNADGTAVVRGHLVEWNQGLAHDGTHSEPASG